MYLLPDDDFEFGAGGHQKGLENAATLKQRAMEQKARDQGKMSLARDVMKADNSAKLQSLRQQLTALKAGQDKQDKAAKDVEQKGSKSGTKTREQQLKSQREDASEQRADATKMAEQGAKFAKAQEETKREEATSEGG